MKKIYSVILLLAVMLSSCTKDETDIMTDDNSNAPALAKTRSDGSDMVEYELLNRRICTSDSYRRTVYNLLP